MQGTNRKEKQNERVGNQYNRVVLLGIAVGLKDRGMLRGMLLQ